MNSLANRAASIVAIILIVSPICAQTWTQATPTTSPSARLQHAMTYDAARQRVVLFGGANTNYLGDTWEWDGSNWSQPAAATSPSARDAHAMTYDAARQRVLLFGGNQSGGIQNDTWEWDGTNWTQAAPTTSPPARAGLALAYDAARQRVVLFGGSQGSVYLSDTWLWDGTNWAQAAPATSPPARALFAMTYDAARQRIVLFGGNQSSGYLSDTWQWDGTNWTQATPATGPLARAGPAMTYDATRQRVVLFGGTHGGLTMFGDTWEWDGTNWTQAAPTVGPSARVSHAMTYDAARQRVALFGGFNLYAKFNDTWVLGGGPLSASATSFGPGCGSPVLTFSPDASMRPILGQVGHATITAAPTPLVGVALGWSDRFFGTTSLPASLASIGMTGCDLLQSAEIIGLGTIPVAPTTLSFSLAIPTQPTLIGAHAYLQSFAFAPGANPAQVTVSNGIDWLLGDV